MKTFALISSLLACVLVTGCAGSGAHTSSMATTAQMSPVNDVMRVGDKFSIKLTGVPEDPGYFTEMQIPASGQITVDYLTQPFQAAGKTPGELAAAITEAYKTQKIYSNPVISIIPEERYVSVGGDVRQPTRVIYSSDSTVMSSINFCGGFTEFANRRAVRLIRGKQVIQVDCVKAASIPGDDPRVYPGDQIWVPRTIL
ncbi:MAG: SLBB domain-containing protein [Methylacidiphilales bacterium]|nr:SLBB domain-containing protein [Candidatus Methylacidiphilales bacterium]